MSMHRFFQPAFAFAVLAALLFSAGCASKKPATITDSNPNDNGGNQADLNDRGLGDGGVDVGMEALPDLPPGTQFTNSSMLQTVYFDYDRESLRSDAAATLENNAGLILNGTVKGYIQIVGHCDERGSQEYNLALGERRALSVREYLMRLGVPGNRIVTMSYGEEVPAVSGSNEEAWAQNRRCEFQVQAL